MLYQDDNQDYLDLLEKSTFLAIESCKYVGVNIQMLSNNKIQFIKWLYKFKERVCDIAIWHKNNCQPAMARRVMNSAFEFIVFFSKENATRAIGTADFRGTLDNVYQSNNQANNEYSKIHSATFPVHFVSHYLSVLTNENESILDLFGGTGTTLIAADQLNRICYMMELDPHYCDVIISRWEQFTNKQAIKIN